MSKADDDSGLSDIWDSVWNYDPLSPLARTDDDDVHAGDDDEDDEIHIISVKRYAWKDKNFLALAENAGWLFHGRLYRLEYTTMFRLLPEYYLSRALVHKRIDKLPPYEQEYARLLFHLRDTYGEVECKSLRESLDGIGTRLRGFELSDSWIERCATNYKLERHMIDGLIADRQYSLDLKFHITESNVERGFNIYELRRRFPNMGYSKLRAGAIFRENFLANHFLAKEEDRFPKCDYDEVVRKLYGGILDIFEMKQYVPDHERLRRTRDWRLRLLDFVGYHYH